MTDTQDSIKTANELILKAIKTSGSGFARSYYRRSPKKKAVPHLTQAKGILLDAVRGSTPPPEALRLLAQVEDEFCHFQSAIRYYERFLAATNKQDRKVLKRLHRLRELAKDAAKLPIPQEQFEELVDYIDRALTNTPCDHTHRHVRLWADKHGVDSERLCRGLEERGGHCDCEVVFNVLN